MMILFLSSASAATISTLSTTAISPTSIAVDANGNTYVTDTFNHRVIKIDGNNVTTVVAGTGVAGFLGDGGLATSAQLDMPMGLSLDAAGNIYIADSLNHRIRKVNIVSGNISTVAGNGIVGAAFQGDGGAATLAGLNTPKGVDVDVNNVIWIADTLNNRIRKVDALGVISTAVGTGVAGFGGDNGVPTAALLNRPRDITVSATGKIYIADELNHRIRLVSGGVIQTFAGTGIAGTLGAGGDASLAQLNRPTGIDVDNNGRVYIADSVNHRIVLIDANAILKTIVGTGIAGYAGDLGNAQLAQLSSPRDVAITTNTTLMLADFVNDAVRSISGGDQDWDGTLDVNDAFPDDPAADTDTDGDLAPDGWLPNASLMQIGASLLIRDEFPFDPARSFTVKEVPVGVNLAGAEFTPAAIPGIYGSDYLYPDPVELDYYYSKGFNYVRLPILWERLQPTMLGALATVEIARVDAFMDAAAQRNMKVILDLHNYGKHTGVLSLPAELADFWAKIAARYSNHAAIFAYDLMNEPNATNGSWPSMAQAAVDAIRTVDTTHAVIVAGGNWSTAMNWQQDNLNLVINDASNNIIYEAHQYFDANHSGTYQDINAIKYTQTYQSVHGTRSYSDVVGERLYTFVGWLKKYNHRGYLGEFGVPAGSIVNGTVDTAWLNLLAPLYNYLDKAGVGWTYWASGPWWQGDAMAIDQIANADSLQMRELLKVLDNDKDGVTNNTDVFIYDAAASVDTDADGFPDIWNAAATQAQKTASALVLDGFPNDPIVGLDADVDGSPDAWNSGVTQAQINASNLLLDAFPNNPNRWVDSIIPVISLIGQSVMDVAHGSAFTDPGSSVLDNVDMNLVISAIGAVNTNAVGTYILTYDAADRTGNVAATVTRTVHITDQRAPVITLTGQSITTIAQGSVFVDLGANVVDNVDGSSTITGVSTVNSNIVGNNYTVTYNVSDAAGNAALTVTRTVHVTDQTAPVITFMGQGVMTVAQGSVFTDPGSAVLDNVDTGLVATVTGAVNINLVGIYSLTYNISDVAGNTAAPVTRIVHVTDQSAPVITLTGQGVVTVAQGSVFTDPSSTVLDNVDTGLVATVSGAVNENAVGTYTLTYNVSDIAGNAATPVTRTIHVTDQTVPVIILTGQNPITITQGSVFTDPGSTVSDNVDVGLVAAVSGAVNVNLVGIYTLTYNISDAAGNAAAAIIRGVHVVAPVGDQVAPVITLTGQSIMTIAQGSVFVDPGANVVDNVDGSSTITGVSTVNSNIVGNNYTVTYNVSDAAGNAALTVTRTVHVTDQTAPVITFMGQGVMTVAQGSVFTDPGSAVLDNVDTGLVATVTGAVNINLVGIYSLTYNISDVAGNTAAPVTRIVHVTDQSAPVITLTGQGVVTVAQGSVFTDPSSTVLDNVDTGLVATVSGAVNENAVGTYTLTYNVSDIAGNAATPVTRTIHVTDQTVPVIILTGQNPITITQGSVFTDPGSTVSDNVDVGLVAAVSGAVNVNLVGIYTLTYNISDAAGNAAATVARTVHVTDQVAPVITLTGQNVITVAQGFAFNDPGSTVSDNVDVGLVATVTGTANANVVGTYTLTYNVSDAAGNAAPTVTRTVHVTDQSSPVITLTGQSVITVAQGFTFNDPGLIVSDNVDVGLVAMVTGAVNEKLIGTYTLTYSVSDAAGNTALTVTRTVHVTDQTAPVITLSGQSVMIVAQAQGSIFTEPGFAVLDNIDMGLVATVTGAVNLNLVGIYTLTYNISDAAGNAAATVRIIHVTDQTAPVMSGVPKNITLLGNVTQGGLLRGGADISMFLGGIAASDNVDGTVIVSNGAPNLFANGTTTIVTFRALDLAGNITTVMATVTVNDPNATGSAALAASGTGLTIAQSIAVGLDSNAATTDTDGDGILDIEEIGDPANPYDQDGDGLLDVFEAHASARDASLVSGLKVTAGTVTVSSTGEYIRNINYQASNGQEPARVIFPYGIIGYDTTVPIGTSKTIRLTFSQQLPANLVLYKVGATGAYAQLPRTSWSVASANSINLILTDGDLTTDMDGVANGIIVDPVAVGSALLNQGASTTSGGGGGGGGCSINTSAEFDPLLIVIMLLSMAYLNRRKFILGKN